MKHTRRQFLVHSAVVTAWGLAPSLPLGANIPLLLDESPTAYRFPTLYNGGDVEVAQKNVPVWPETTTDRIVLNSLPLLAFEFEKGSSVSIPIRNQLTSPISIHWHGLDVPSAMDGHPKDAFSAGSTKEYAFAVRNRAGLYFFHSHSHMATAREVYMGLMGLVIVRDQEERQLSLPSGEYELPLVIQDVRVDPAGKVAYSPTMNDMMNGWMGNRILVNGTPNTTHSVKRGAYRLRIVNASNARVYKLQFSNALPFTIIGTDGGLLEEPAVVTSVQLAPAERLDILVDFSTLAQGEIVRLISAPYTSPVEMMSPLYPQGIALDIMSFIGSGEQGIQYSVPAKLCTLPTVPEVTTTRTFALAMSRGMGMGMRPTINGKTYDIDRVDFQVTGGTYEIWQFQNQENAMSHPMHIHGRQFRVLSRSNGALLPTDKGLKDTVLVGPSETVRVAVQHSEYPGLFLFHCHNLEHEDEGMMQNYTVFVPTGIEEREPTDTMLYPNPTADSFVVQSQALEHGGVTIYDSMGRLVKQLHSMVPGSPISVADLPSATY
ncbi:MAG: multicopper oxidase domain-containing protein, partial [Ignavibacteria bacterium]